VRKIFGRDGNTKIKRLIDDHDSDEELKSHQSVKKIPKRDEKATDLLAQTQPVGKRESWEKSIGVINTKKASLVVVKKKVSPSIVTAKIAPQASTSTLGSLGLLGNYSDSDESID